MDVLLKVLFLAVVQGITEFLPISSSGHLVLLKHFLGLDAGAEGSSPLLEIVLHGGTLISIVAFYRVRLWRVASGVLRGEKESLRFAFLVLLGCLPAIIVAFTAGDRLEAAFSHPRFVAWALMGTGIFLISTRFVRQGRRRVGWLSGLIIGLAQCVAMLPGVSRSGSTLGISRYLGIEPGEAAEYSFLMLVPLLTGAMLLAAVDVAKHGNHSGCSASVLAAGFAVSAVVGYFALKWLVNLLRRGQFWLFGIYCLAVGAISLVLLSL